MQNPKSWVKDCASKKIHSHHYTARYASLALHARQSNNSNFLFLSHSLLIF